MIKDWKGKKLTPKQASKRILTNAMQTMHYWIEKDSRFEKEFTEKEIESINKQLQKIESRIEKYLNLNGNDYDSL